jgi:hypothetical protein
MGLILSPEASYSDILYDFTVYPPYKRWKLLKQAISASFHNNFYLKQF